MLYAIFNNCNSLTEVTTGMLASEQRLVHVASGIIPGEVLFQMPISGVNQKSLNLGACLNQNPKI
jgi:hypothetical protein